METLKLSKNDFNRDNVYVGKTDGPDWPGHIYIDPHLGVVQFPKSLCAKGEIVACNGTGVIVGCGISAGKEVKIGEKYYVLVGTNSWDNKEYEIRCSEFTGGRVKLGKLVITESQIKPETCDGKVIEIDGKRYRLVSE